MPMRLSPDGTSNAGPFHECLKYRGSMTARILTTMSILTKA